MKLETKISILTVLFGVQSALQLINGVLGLLGGVSYGEYGDAFIQAGIMGYLAYVVYKTRTKWTYWFAMFFVGLAVVRSVVGIGLIAYSGIAPSAGETILMTFVVVTFGLIPLLLLLNKEIRVAYLSSEI